MLLLLFIVADIVFSDGKVSSYLHVGNIVYTVWNVADLSFFV